MNSSHDTLGTIRHAVAISAISLVLFSTSAHAQGSEAFAVVGAGVASNGYSSAGLLNLAAGYEALIGDRFNVGPAIGISSGRGVFLDLSGTGRVRLGRNPSTQRLTPFIAGGYSYLTAFYAAAHAVHFGGGVDVRLNPRRAARLEVRDTVRPGYSDAHYLSFRVGMTFR